MEPVADSDKGPRQRIWVFVRPHARLAVFATAALLVTVGLTLLLPIAVRFLVDGFADPDASRMNGVFAMAACVAVLFSIASSFRIYYIKLLGERTVADIRKAIFAHAIRMSPAYFERVLTGDVLSRITTDSTLILNVIGWSLAMGLRNVLMLIGGLTMMVVTSAKLTLAGLLLVPVIIVPIVVFGRRLKTHSAESQEWIAKSSGQASEALLASQTVQAFSGRGAGVDPV